MPGPLMAPSATSPFMWPRAPALFFHPQLAAQAAVDVDKLTSATVGAESKSSPNTSGTTTSVDTPPNENQSPLSSAPQ